MRCLEQVTQIICSPQVEKWVQDAGPAILHSSMGAWETHTMQGLLQRLGKLQEGLANRLTGPSDGIG